MSKSDKTQFVCNGCGFDSPIWAGKCPNCGEWNTMVEFHSTKLKSQNSKIKNGRCGTTIGSNVKPIRLAEVEAISTTRMATGIGEFDRVLGGGFVFGSVILMAGEPGVGKSTLILNIVDKLRNCDILYITGEESPAQVKVRAERLGLTNERLALLTETNIDSIFASVKRGDFLIIDSIQTVWSEDYDGSPGSVAQIKGCTQKVIENAKKEGITVLLVGHINKEGEVAGPMMLAHMVDAVLFLEGERFAELKLLRGIKNRFGPTDEVGVFKMTDKGMEEVTNPSGFLLEDDKSESGSAGRVVLVTMEGTRPILVEVQALVTKSFLPMPRRVGMGVDSNRLNLLTAVLQKSLNLPLYDQDIFVKIGGGLKIGEPAADLAICLAIISSFKSAPMPPKTVVFGEVGLLGELKRVGSEEKREKEARKLGYSKIVSVKGYSNLKMVLGLLG